MLALGEMNAAVSGGDLETAKTVVRRHPELLHHRDPKGNTWLHGAARHGQPEIVAWLCSQGLDPNDKNGRGLTPTWMAQNAEHLNAFRALLVAGANPNHGVNGESLVFSVARTFLMRNELPWLKLLYEYGANINQKDKDRRTILHHAAMSGNADVCLLVLQYGADKDEKDPIHNCGVIALARKWGNDAAADCVEAWLQAKAAQDAIDQLSTTSDIRPLDAFRP